MKKYFVVIMAFMLYSTAYAEIVESSVKDSSVHEETIVAKDGDETYTTAIYRSNNSANEVHSSDSKWHEATSAEAYYKETVVGSDGYNSSFEELYANASDVVNGENKYVSSYMEGYMRDESEHNPETMRDTAVYESSKYIENVSDMDGTYKEDIYGESTWKSSFSEPGYSEAINAQSIWDSDVTIAPDYYESNLAKSSMYDETVNEGGYESSYFESSDYKEHVADSDEAYVEDVYGQSILKTSVSENGDSTAIYGESVHDSDVQISRNSWASDLYKSNAYMEIVSSEDYESNVAHINTYEESLAKYF